MKEYRQSLKNYTTKARTMDMINNIQKILLDFGATGIGFSYDQGKIIGIHFRIETPTGTQVINLPLRTEKVSQVLKNDGYYKDEDHSYRVALANIRDWLDAQMALLRTEMVEFPEIFLPYMADQQGRTLYEIMKGNKFALPEPK